MKQKILYLSYNGMMEPLGASQVLSYLYKLSNEYEYYLISLEKQEDLKNIEAFNQLQETVKKFGIKWLPLTYETSLLGKRMNLFRFTKTAYSILKRENIKFIHCRSYFPAISAYLIKKVIPVKYLFDTRGFAFDERADVGSINRSGLVFKIMKWLEKKLYLNASGINKLSHLGKQTILENKLFEGGNKIVDISVIPTCVDLDRFTFCERCYEDPITIGYIGTTVGWYDFDKTAKVLSKIMKVRKVNFLVFNGNQHDYIKSKLLENDIREEDFKIEKVPFSNMPERLKEIDIALFFIYPFFSKKASAATKMGELFASGIPVLTNGNVGDHEYYINAYNAGKIIDFNKIETYDFNSIIEELTTSEVAHNCRMVAEKYFSLEKGYKDYKKLYNRIFKD